MELLIELARLQKSNLRLKWILGIVLVAGLTYWFLRDDREVALDD